MTTAIEEILFDPVIGKVVAIFIGVSIILLVAKILKATVRKRIADTQNRYRIAKLITFGSYIMVLLPLTVVFGRSLLRSRTWRDRWSLVGAHVARLAMCS